eukprot:1142660-Pyramimonas_sp.AAC.1
MAKPQCKHAFSVRKTGASRCGYTTLNAKMQIASARGGGMPLIDSMQRERCCTPKPSGENPMHKFIIRSENGDIPVWIYDIECTSSNRQRARR